jgi:hypothetical protein
LSRPRAETLVRLGDVHHDTGDSTAARAAWHQALAIFDDLNHPDAEKVRVRLQS